MATLYPAAYAEFSRMLDELAPEIPGMVKESSRNFLTDMIAKRDQYREGVFVSPKQLNWIKSLHEEFVGDTAHEREDADGDPRDRDGW